MDWMAVGIGIVCWNEPEASGFTSGAAQDDDALRLTLGESRATGPRPLRLARRAAGGRYQLAERPRHALAGCAPWAGLPLLAGQPGQVGLGSDQAKLLRQLGDELEVPGIVLQVAHRVGAIDGIGLAK